MTSDQAVAALRKAGKAGTARVYRRHGAQGEVLGVSSAAINALVKKIGVDHALAGQLWKTGIHEARVVATKVADPERVTATDLDRWLAEVSDYILADGVAGLAARAPGGLTAARGWIGAKSEWISATGWSVLGVAAADGRIGEREATRLIGKIQKGIARAPNRTRYSMNNALISIGGGMPALTDSALAAATAIGPVDVDHGETGCKTPDAVTYIPKMVAHRRKRTRATGARLAGRKS
jgi:3-methyladenine DNA glycosylase AlkD